MLKTRALTSVQVDKSSSDTLRRAYSLHLELEEIHRELLATMQEDGTTLSEASRDFQLTH